MKLFLMIAIVQAAILLVSGADNFKLVSLRDFASQLRIDKAGFTGNGENVRQARILTTYTSDIKRNTADTVTAIGNLQTAVAATTSSVDGLRTSVNQNHASVLSALNQLKIDVGSSGQLVTLLTSIDGNIAALKNALVDTSSTDSLQKLLSDLKTVLETKLTNIETILGP